MEKTRDNAPSMSDNAKHALVSPVRTLSASELDAVAGGLAKKLPGGCFPRPPRLPLATM